jgi:hypothetical protein
LLMLCLGENIVHFWNSVIRNPCGEKFKRTVCRDGYFFFSSQKI